MFNKRFVERKNVTNIDLTALAPFDIPSIRCRIVAYPSSIAVLCYTWIVIAAAGEVGCTMHLHD